jgi:hypothetical protein
VRDTTLLIAPHTLADFLDFNDFTARAERQLARAGFDGVFQLASFHPQFQFAGTEPDDIGNATNRAPYPTLHLLREDSVSRAVEAFPGAEAIFERNIDTLEALGAARLGRARRRARECQAMNTKLGQTREDEQGRQGRRELPRSCGRASPSSC